MIDRFKVSFKFIGRRGLSWLALGVLFGLLSSGIELTLAFLLQILLLRLNISNQSVKAPFGLHVNFLSNGGLATVFFLVALAKGFVSFVLAQSVVVSNEIIALRLRLLLLHESFDRTRGYVSLSDLDYKSSFLFPRAVNFSYYLALAIPNFGYTLFLFVALLRIQWKAAIVCLAGVVLIGLPVIYLNRTIRKRSSATNLMLSKLSHRIHSAVKNFFFLKAMAMHKKVLEDSVDQTLAVSASWLRAGAVASAASYLPTIFSGVFVSVFIFMQLNGGVMEPLVFVSFLYMFMRFGQGLAQAGAYYSNLSSTHPQWKESLRYFEDLEPALRERALAKVNHLTSLGNVKALKESLEPAIFPGGLSTSPPEISIQSVDFSYPGSSRKVFHGFSIEIPGGSILAIRGASGAGKSTLIALMMGVIEPTAGRLLIGRKSPEEYLRRSGGVIGYVGAEPYLIEGTVRDNLIFGMRGKYSDADLIEQLGNVRLWGEIAQFGDGLARPISESGEGLSAGQKQRLSLARALLLRPKVLILDEATSNLDDANEEGILAIVRSLRGKTTTIIVSHRLKPLEIADRRLELSGI